MTEARFVQEHIKLGHYKYDDTKHIVLCGDKNYLKYCGITMTSVFVSNPQSYFEMHILCDDVGKDDLQKFEAVSCKYKVNINIYKLDTNLIEELAYGVDTTSHINVAAFFRIIAFNILKEKTDTILYLDADILVTGCVDDFWKLELNDKQYAIVVGDIIEEMFKKNMDNNGIKLQRYFNSGVMFVDLIKWNENDYTDVCIENIKKYRYKFMDQDALNVVLDGKCLYFPKRFNYICDLGEIMNHVKRISSTDVVPDQVDARIVHFCGRSKPWHSWVKDFKIAQQYMDIQKQSQWKNNIYIRACDVKDKCYRYKYTRMEMKAAAKECRYMQMFGYAVAYMWYKMVYLLSRK